MAVSVLSAELDADWEVAAEFSKIIICKIELFTLLTILNIPGLLLSAITALLVLVAALSEPSFLLMSWCALKQLNLHPEIVHL